MANPYHVYRLSDCMERIGRRKEPILIQCCNQDCRPGTDVCAHHSSFEPLVDLPLSIILIHHRDLPNILMLHPGLRWGDAVLMLDGRVVRHWQCMPSRTELDTILAELSELQDK